MSTPKGKELLKQINLRMLAPEDLPQVMAIDAKMGPHRGKEYWQKKFELAENRPPMASIVADLDGRVVGFVMGEVSGWEFGVPEDYAWLNIIGVDPDFEGMGVGRLLVEELLHQFKMIGVTTVYTVVNWADPKLIPFFSRMGFHRGDLVNLERKID